MSLNSTQALGFDVFGTVVDWRNGIARQVAPFLAVYGSHLDPWPDVLEGLQRLRRRFVLVPMSNGNIALLLHMARRAGLPWDAILGSEVTQAYKPMPAAYLRTAEVLGIPAHALCLVAAHNDDLAAASACGLATAFVVRPHEHGPAQTIDLTPEGPWNLNARDMIDLADQLGC